MDPNWGGRAVSYSPTNCGCLLIYFAGDYFVLWAVIERLFRILETFYLIYLYYIGFMRSFCLFMDIFGLF